jgi:hypothetical protein
MERPPHFSVGQTIQGTLSLETMKIPVSLTIRNIQPDRIGCEFSSIDHAAQGSLQGYLAPIELGKSLKPFPPSTMKLIQYQGHCGTRLEISRSPDGQFTEGFLLFQNLYVGWNESNGLQMGQATAPPQKHRCEGLYKLETLCLNAYKKIDLNQLEVAKNLILSSHLPDTIKNWCARHFKEDQWIGTLP